MNNEETSEYHAYDCWLQVNEDSPRDVLSRTSLREEGVVGVVLDADVVIARHQSIRANPMLETI